MDALRAVATILGLTAAESTAALRSSFRALFSWTVGIASRQAELVTILSQSLTLCLLSLVITYIRRPAARRQSRGRLGFARSDG
ncbi:MAG: hypothetical protein ABR961_13385 [Thermoanaerobaculaceae bacterium]|jgi:hypothetical protein